ncbi:MAG: DnaA/Hda family protein [Planctomycetaceae bacterium]|nr:DnaA/Hda family protein [Planctomycetaceae bacterium]
MESAENTVNLHDNITKKVFGALEVLLGKERFAVWFSGSAVQLKEENENKTLVFTVRNRFAADWIKNNFGKELEQVCVLIFNQVLPIHFVLGGSPFSPLKSGGDAQKRVYSAEYSAPPPEQNPALKTAGPRFHSLKTFVEGMSNRLACRAVDLALNHPGKITPMYISGPSSVGKTHLLEGIWTEYRKKRKTPLYMTAEQFTAAFMEAIQRGTTRNEIAEFHNRFKNIAILLIDDIQHFINKDATQNILIQTIDTLQSKGIQIVLSGSIPFQNLENRLKPEIVSRIQAGMICPIEQPERETSLKIVQNLVAERKLPFGDDICRMIASRFGIHARQLHGAVNLLHASFPTTDEPLTLKAAEETLAKLESYQRRNVRLQDINKAVCETFGLSEDALKSKSRIEPISTARTLAMFLARKHTGAALVEIGHFFGGRKHSTVISAQKKVDGWVDSAHPINAGHFALPVPEAIQRIERVLQSQ